MNRIYKVIFNQALQVYQVVSELSKGHAKSSTLSVVRKNRRASKLSTIQKLLLVSLASGMMVSSAFADTTVSLGSVTQVQSGSNIILSSDGTTLTIGTDPALSATTLTTGNTVVNTSGLTITGGPSITATGISAGGEKITNVSAGNVSSANSTDAINGGQLFTTNQNIATNKTNIATNASDISGLKTRATTDETQIATNKTNIATNANDISGLKTRATTDETQIATNTANIATNASDINKLQTTSLGVKYFRTNATGTDASATGTDAIAVGSSAVSSGADAIATGYSANAAAANSVAIGVSATVGGATVGGARGIAIGDAASVTADNALALGATASANGVSGIALGTSANAYSDNSIAIGLSAVTDGAQGIAIGDGTTVSGASGLAIGTSASAAADAIAFGKSASASADGLAFGTSASAAADAIALGTSANAVGTNSIAQGTSASAAGASSIALGTSANTSGSGDISLGSSAGTGTTGTTTAQNQANRIALGTNAGQSVSGNEDIAIGLSAGDKVSGNYNIAIGSSAGSSTGGDENVAIGYNANSTKAAGSHSTAVGAATIASSGATALGYLADAAGQNSIAIGYEASAVSSSGIAIGVNATAADNSSVALGNASYATATDSTGTGYLTGTTSGVGVISVGSSGKNGQTFQRRITNVAAGSSNYDAVNVEQLKLVQTSVANLIGGGVSVSAAGVYSQITLTDTSNVQHKYDTVADALNALSTGTISVLPSGTITYSDSTNANVKLSGASGTTISNVANAVTTDQAVNLGQMNTAIAASSTKYFSVNSTVGGNAGNLGATGTNAIAVGGAVTATGVESISMGYNTKAVGDDSIVLGNAASSTDRQTVAYDTSGVAIGTSASSTGANSIALGTYAQTGLQSSPTTTANNAIAIGYYAEATADSAIALGQAAHASGVDSIAQGYTASATGTSSIAVGTDTTATGTSSTALGSYITVSAANSGVIGSTMSSGATGTTLSGSDTYAIGNGDSIAASNSSIIGNASTVYSKNSSITGNSNTIGAYVPTDPTGLNHDTISTTNSSVLGNINTVTAQNSEIIGNSNTVGTFDNTTYSYTYAIGSGVLGNSNSLTGSNDRIIGNNNTVSDLSDVLILGNGITASLGNSVYLGTGAAYVAATDSSNSTAGVSTYNGATIGNGTYTFAGTTPVGVVTVGTTGSTRRIQNVSAGLVSATSTDAVNGSELYALTQPLRFAGDNSTVGTTSSSDTNVIQRSSSQALSIIGGASTNSLTTGNIGVVANTATDTLTVQLAKDLTDLTSVTTGNTVMNTSGITVNGGSSVVTLTKSGLSNGGNTITNVKAGVNTTDAVNLGQLTTASSTLTSSGLNFVGNDGNTIHKDLGSTLGIVGSSTLTGSTSTTNVKTVKNSSGNLEIQLADNAIFTSVTAGTGTSQVVIGSSGLQVGGKTYITGSGINANSQKITSVLAGDVSATSTDAVNGSQLNAVSTVANKGWNTTTKATGTGTVSGTSTANVAPGATVTTTAGNNISITQNGTDLTIATNPDLVSTSLTTGNTKVNTTGVTVNEGTNSTSLTSTGLTVGASGLGITTTGGVNAGSKKIINVAVGDVTSTSTDAVNGSQLYTTNQTLNDVKTTVNKGWNLTTSGANSSNVALGGTVDFSNTDGNVSVSNSGTNVNVNLASKVTLGSGTDAVVIDGTAGTISAGSGTTKVTLNGDTGTGKIGNVTITGSGSTGTVNGLTNRAWDPTNIVSGQAATEDQLKSAATSITNTLTTSGLNFAGNTGTTLHKNLGATLNIIGGYTGNGTTSTTNVKTVADSEGNLEIQLADNAAFTSVTAGTGTSQVVIGSSGVQVGGNTYITGTGINANSKTIINVAAGTNDTDAANVSQVKKATTTVSAGKNIGVVSSTVTADGHTDYAVSLDDTVTLGSGSSKIVLDGTAGTIATGTTTVTGSGITAGNTTITGGVVTVGSGVTKVTVDGTAGTVTAGTVVVNKNNTGTVNGLTNTTWNPASIVSGQAATEDQLKSASSSLTTSGLTFAGNTGTAIHKNLGETLNVIGSSTLSGTTSTTNVKTVADSDGNLEIQLADNTTFTSVTTGNTVMNNSGIAISGGPNDSVSLTNTGLNNGGNTITNVAAGTSDTDAANVSQVKKATTTVSDGKNTTVSYTKAGDGHTDYEVNLNDNITLGGTYQGSSPYINIDGTTGLLTLSGGSNTITINGSTGTINGLTNKTWTAGSIVSGQAATEDQLQTAVAASTTSVSAGSNVSVSSTTESDGHTNYKVALKDDVTLGSGTLGQIDLSSSTGTITTGSTTVTGTGITTGGTTITGGVITAGTGPNQVTINGNTATVQAGTGTNKVILDGTAGTISAGTKVTLDGANGTGTIGNVTINGSGSTGTVNGLTNKTWDSTNYVSGQAATEDQLKSVSDVANSAAAEAAKHSSVSAGSNVTVSQNGTNPSGGVDYKVSLSNDVTLGGEGTTGQISLSSSDGTVTVGTDSQNKVVINGTTGNITSGNVAISSTGKITAGSGTTAVSIDGTVGTVTAGTVVVNSNNAGTINGLTNKTWNPDSIVSGQAATEDQLKVLDAKTVQYDANSDGSVNTSKITLGGTSGTTITNVTAGTLSSTSTDAVNGSQLYATNQAVSTNATNIDTLFGQTSYLNSRINKVGAGAAALAGLHPLDYDPTSKWDFAAAYGHYAGSGAFALGAFYRPNADTMVSFGSSINQDDNMYNVGISFKFGSTSKYRNVSKATIVQDVASLEDKNKALAEQNKVLADQVNLLTKQVNAIMVAMNTAPTSADQQGQHK